MVMELLGPNIETLFKFCNRRFSLPTTVMIGEQFLALIEHLHSKSFVHRDIKPDNFVTGTNDKENLLYMIDFGLAKRYRDPKTKLHIPYRDNKSLTGTARYASINTHIGVDQSRRDDIEAFSYVLIYFLRGSLPWQGIRACPKKEKYDKIMECKMSTPVELICKNLPREFAGILYYARSLQFEEKPDYGYIRNLLYKTIQDNFPVYDPVFDWILIKVSFYDILIVLYRIIKKFLFQK